MAEKAQNDAKKQNKTRDRTTRLEEINMHDDEQLPTSLAVGGTASSGDTIDSQAALLGDKRLTAGQRQAMTTMIGQTAGNKYLQRVMQKVNHKRREKNNRPSSVQLNEGPGRLASLQRQDVDVEILEIPEHTGTVEDIATDSIRTMRAMLANLHTAIENFQTAIASESQAEAAPKDATTIVLEQISNFALGQLRSFATGLVPGGRILNDLVSLGTNISGAIETERRRSAAAFDRNAAANFIIRIRTQISEANAIIESNMTEDIVAVRNRHANATSEGHRQAIRNHQEVLNQQITSRLESQFSVGALFTRITEIWINQSQAPGRSHESRVYIKLGKDWNVIQAYLQAPFGSRLAEQLSNVGSLDLVNFNVPRVIIWYPHSDQNDWITNVTANLSPDSRTLINLRSNITGRRFVNQFMQNIRTRPIPDTTQISGSQTSN